MAGEPFTVSSWIADPKEAFRACKDQALYDLGHSGYTGSIAEKPGFVIRKKEPMTISESKAFIYGAGDIPGDQNSNEKWGDAYAVPLCKETGGPIAGWCFYGWASS